MARLERQTDLLSQYFKTSGLPTQWCSGCGCGIVSQALIRAIHRTGIQSERFAFVTGIGCNGFIPRYLNFNELHVTHGRAPAYATGLKLARPDLEVILIQGDGDCAAIGGNHFIHAARRNINLTAIVSNNFIYGRTGGQYGPTTFQGDYATTAPYGLIEPAFDLCKLAEAAGATYVARGTVYHALQLIPIIEKGIEHRGFSFIEVITQCPTNYGRRNREKMGATGVEMMRWQKEHAVSVEKARTMSDEELKDKIVIGTFVDKDRPEYTEQYAALRERVLKEVH
jgi:2-oxoglutarate ferredoxin oxidoreductase subunit beta